MKTLTVSIAAYNVEKYIEKTLDSLCCSKYLEDMEILVQTNAATDLTVQVAKKYEEKYPSSIRVVEREVNGGYGSTINDSISMATGKYFKTLDGDDWYDSEHLDEFISELKTLDSDLVICDFSAYADEQLASKWTPSSLEPRKEYTPDVLTDCRMHSLTVRTSILQENNISITENCFYTDIEYFLKSFKFANSVIYIPLNIYCYRVGMNEQSVSLKSHLRNLADYELIVKEIVSDFYFDPKYFSMRGPLRWKVISHLRYLALTKPYKSSKQRFLEFYDYLKDNGVTLDPDQYRTHVKLVLKLIQRNPKRWFFVFRMSVKLYAKLQG
ncbi:MAG: glycosyltransferase family 2 protein [Clostridia bacterium]|nr:glycosyltransferase family 2 protein [Clostridia bacterium]